MKFTTKAQKWGYGIIFLGPACACFAVIVLIPFILGMYYSMTSWNGVSSEVTWIGFNNFIHLLTDKGFKSSFLFTMQYTLVAVLLQNILGFLLAVLLVQRLKFTRFLRTVFFVPNVISGLLLGFIFQFIFIKAFASIGELTGIPLFNLPWLGTEATGFWGIVIVSVWQMSGYLMVIYIAGLNSIPEDILESSYIEGISFWQRLIHIQIPMVMTSITVCLFLSTSWAFKIFDLNYSLTNGGPFNSTKSVALDIYNDAFLNSRYGLGTAKALIFFIVVGIITIIQVKLTSRNEVSA